MINVACVALLLLAGHGARAEGGEGCPDRWSILQLVQYHQGVKKSVHVQDVYKMLYQAYFGVEHLLTDTSAARRYLLEELASMDTVFRDEPLIERISTNCGMVRVNLRPFARLGLDPYLLLSLMVRSAAETVRDTVMFYNEWNNFSALVEYGVLQFSQTERARWDSTVASGDLRPVHHSEEYAKSNAPAYRVLRSAEALHLVEGKKE